MKLHRMSRLRLVRAEKQGSSRFDFTSSAALDALSCIAEFDFQGLETHDSWHTASLEKADFGDKHHEGMETLIRGIGDDHVSVDRLLGFPSEIQDADLFEESDSIDVPGGEKTSCHEAGAPADIYRHGPGICFTSSRAASRGDRYV